MSIVFKNECASCIDTPLCNKTTMYVDKDDGVVKLKDNNENINCLVCNANLSTYAQCTDVPTNNNQLTNGCGYFKGYGFCSFINTIRCASCITAPVSGIMVGYLTHYYSCGFILTDITASPAVSYVLPSEGSYIIPVCANHVYKMSYNGGQSNGDYVNTSGIITFSC